MTAVTSTQPSIMRKFGLSRIIAANELVDRSTLIWVAREMGVDPEFELYSLVDNAQAVAVADEILADPGHFEAINALLPSSSGTTSPPGPR